MKRYPHKLDRSVTATMNMGLNYPLIPMEVYPGESFKLQFENLTRFLAQVAPTMHNVNVNVETYEVPWRQLFDKLGLSWDDFLTGGEDGLTEVSIPQVITPANGYEPGSLADFLGIPTNYVDPDTGVTVVQGSISVSALPVIAYMHVINENYRDENFVKKLDLNRYQEFLDGTYQFQNAAGVNIDTLFRTDHPGIFPRAWTRDYFGRAMPNTQRGISASIGIGGDASLSPMTALVLTDSGGLMKSNITSEGTITWKADDDSWSVTFMFEVSKDMYYKAAAADNLNPSKASIKCTVLSHTGTPVLGDFYMNITTAGTRTYFVYNNILPILIPSPNSSIPGTWSNGSPVFTRDTSVTSVADLSGVTADLANATAVQIRDFRLAARMQQFGEWLQQAGARAVEFTLKFFGVRIPDSRVQRPIYHGAYKCPVMFSEVLQTSESTSSNPLGNLAGHGITGGKNAPMHIKVVEHGFIVHIVSIMPRSQFQNILPKMYLRQSRFDIPNPIFSSIGEQAIEQIEIFPRTSTPDAVFGYVPHYNELSFMPSTVHGHMKDTFAHWHMARMYSSEPVLSAKWRYEEPTNRSFAVQDEDEIQISVGVYCQARRLFPANPMCGIHIV